MKNSSAIYGKAKKRGGAKKFVILIIVLILVFIALFGFIFIRSTAAYKPDSNEQVVVTIPEGTYANQIGDILQDEGVIRSSSIFNIYSRIRGYSSKFKAGSYTLSPNMSMGMIGKMISSGDTTDLDFTIPEGYDEYDIADTVSSLGYVDRDEFVRLLETKDYSNDYSFLKGAQDNSHRLEGYLFPSTYALPLDSDGDAIIRAMLDKYDSIFTEEYRKRAKELGYSENEIIIVASIIERESGNEEDRAKIASVIYNRLDADMPLQMCSTVLYALDLTGVKKSYVTYADTTIDSPYNTYVHKGLPPGPISCPGEASIKAALYPEDTDYLYFVLSEKLDGSSFFSKDYEEFQKHSDAYSKAMEEAEKNKSSN